MNKTYRRLRSILVDTNVDIAVGSMTGRCLGGSCEFGYVFLISTFVLSTFVLFTFVLPTFVLSTLKSKRVFFLCCYLKLRLAVTA